MQHELAEQIWKNCRMGVREDYDNIITSWLQKKAEELQARSFKRKGQFEALQISISDAKEILGLSEPDYAQMAIESGRNSGTSPSMGQEWCKCPGIALDSWKFCPLCGIPRPAKRTLTEIIYKSYTDQAKTPMVSFKRIANDCRAYFRELVESIESTPIYGHDWITKPALLAKMEEA